MHRLFGSWLVVVLLLGSLAPRLTQAQGTPLCFNVPGITNCIEGRLREYWEQNGDLPVFGYPITPAAPTPTSDGSFTSQYFERNRFELHPELPRPYDVLLGRLGDLRLQQQGRDWRSFPRGQEQPDCLWFAETGHSICEPFKSYWESHGLADPALPPFERSLALFGLPLSEPSVETNADGAAVLSQWFERARFEYHGPQIGVLLGLLGREVLAPGTPAPPLPPSARTLVFRPSADTFVHQEFPDQNFGRDGLLVVDVNPYRESYFKFELRGLTGRVVAAKLRLYVTTIPTHDGGSPRGGSAVLMRDLNWSESTVTYNTRPSIAGPLLDTLGEVSPGQWYELDVSAAITGNGTLGLGLVSDDANGTYYTSREVEQTAPELVITLSPDS